MYALCMCVLYGLLPHINGNHLVFSPYKHNAVTAGLFYYHQEANGHVHYKEET